MTRTLIATQNNSKSGGIVFKPDPRISAYVTYLEGLEEGLYRQNAGRLLEAVGVGALDRDLELDMRNAQQILSKSEDRRGFHEPRLLAPTKALARLDVTGIGPAA